jgi:hypothetical protein
MGSGAGGSDETERARAARTGVLCTARWWDDYVRVMIVDVASRLLPYGAGGARGHKLAGGGDPQISMSNHQPYAL